MTAIKQILRFKKKIRFLGDFGQYQPYWLGVKKNMKKFAFFNIFIRLVVLSATKSISWSQSTNTHLFAVLI